MADNSISPASVVCSMRQAIIASTLVCLLLAGCTSPGSSGTDSSDLAGADLPPELVVVEPFDVAFSASDCLELGVVIFVSLQHAQSLLPEGFVAADAQDFLGTPTPFNRAAVFLTDTHCAQSNLSADPLTEALIGITIEAPDLPATGEATVHFYQLAAGTQTGKVAELLSRVNWTIQADEMTAALSSGPLLQATGSVSLNGTKVYDLGVTSSPMTTAFGGTYRWWQQTPYGVGLFDYTLEVDGYLGRATCTITPGTLAAKAAATTSCATAEALGIIADGLEFTGGFQWLGRV